jgi:hypothetical protein
MAHGVLTLVFEIVDDRPDRPMLGIRVNGRNPFEASRNCGGDFIPPPFSERVHR